MANPSAQRILEFIQKTFANQAAPGEALTPSTPLVSSQLIDSMGVVELLVFLERECGVPVNMTMEELRTLDTAERLARHLEQLQAVRQPS